jgi:hypothetical protein
MEMRPIAIAALLWACGPGSAETPREAIALKVEVDGDMAKVTVAFNYTGKAGNP